jgi:hypothetical protein
MFHTNNRTNSDGLSSYRRLICFYSREGQVISYTVFLHSSLTLLSIAPYFVVLYLFILLNYVYICRLLAVLRTNLRRSEQNSQNMLLHCINFYFNKPASVLFVVSFYCCKKVTTNLRILHTLRSSDITSAFLCVIVTVTVVSQTVCPSAHTSLILQPTKPHTRSSIHSLVTSVRWKP